METSRRAYSGVPWRLSAIWLWAVSLSPFPNITFFLWCVNVKGVITVFVCIDIFANMGFSLWIGWRVGLVTEPLTRTRIRGHISGSPYPEQLLSTVWIMRIYDLAGSSYDAEKHIKCTLGAGGLTHDTRADFPFFSCPLWLHMEGRRFTFTISWSEVRGAGVSNLSCFSTVEVFFSRNCDKSWECVQHVWWGVAGGLHHSQMPP